MTVLRTLFFFLVLVLAVRLLGKRQVGQMEPAEFVVALLIADLAVIPIENPAAPLWRGLAPIAVVFAAERLLSALSFRSIRLRRLLCGKPVILVENGRPVLRNLRRTRVNLDELAGQLRLQGILELQQVQYAILETSGSLAVFPYPRFRPAAAQDAGIPVENPELPCTVISRGRVLRENLAAAGRSEVWLAQVLDRAGCPRADVVLLTVTQSGRTVLLRRSDCR